MSIINIMMKKLAGCQNDDQSRVMYRAIELTLTPSDFTNESRLLSYINLLNLCAKERNEDMVAFTRGLIAADYNFSVGKGLRAVPFLNESLQKYGKCSGAEPLSVDDAESFVGNFRAINLSGKFQREKKAVRNILIMNRVTHEMKIDLNLEELVLDHVPNSYVWEGFLFSLVLIIAGVSMALYPFEEYRIARLSGSYMPFFDALQLGETPLIIIGASVAIMAGWYTLMKCTPAHVNLMSRYYYWRYFHR